MIHVFVGTKAQFIKMAPLMVELRNRGIRFRYVDSGQHAALTRTLRRVFGVAEPDFSLRADGDDITSIPQAAMWFGRQLWSGLADSRWLREEVFPGGGICLIHGDTLTTLMGMQLAKRAGLAVAHVEAGLRSFKLFDPFPEELIRLLCMRRSEVLFAPSVDTRFNLEQLGVSGMIIETPGNTVADSIRLMSDAATEIEVPSEPFALATCHRFETITNKARLRNVLELLNAVAEEMRVVFVAHKPTWRYLRRFGLERALSERVTRLGMQDYTSFLALLKSARLVLTDGGSIQEECAYLCKPCLVLRHATERSDGLGRTATLWKFDPSIAERFLRDALAAEPVDPGELPSPSAAIVDSLVEMGYAAPSARMTAS